MLLGTTWHQGSMVPPFVADAVRRPGAPWAAPAGMVRLAPDLEARKRRPATGTPLRFSTSCDADQAVARRRAIDHHRRKRPGGADADDVGRDPAPTSEAEEALVAIRALPEAYRETMMMRLVEGLTGPEIANLTGMTPESVRVNLCRGMKLLRERLGEAT